MSILSLRLSLKAGGYAPIPVSGKRPPMTGWSQFTDALEDDIKAWEKSYPYAASTGILTKATPALDIDITSEPAAEAVESLARERFEEAGFFLVRTGKAPKRAVLFRCDQPFKKISVELISPNGGSGQKLEFLCDGQQLVAFGLHKDTKQPYRWHGGEPGKIRRADLPYIDEAQARRLINHAGDLLCKDFGYKRVPERPRKKGNGAAAGAADWASLSEAIRKQHNLHDSLRDLAAKLVASGMDTGAAINFLRAAMDQAEGEHDARWKARRDDIPRLVESAIEEPKQEAPPSEPRSLAEVHAIFERWFGKSYDTHVIDAVLATAAAERLAGDPLWLLVISGPGNTKTETVQSLAGAGAHITSTISSEGALLSATPRKSRAKTATGGLLRKLGDRGLLVIKDVTSILSADRNTRAGVLAALREVYDGRWERNVGSDGGQTLTWTGRIAVVGAVTTAWDTAHAVVSVMGDRFVLIRSDSKVGRNKAGTQAIANTGTETAMRAEIAAAVGGIIGHIETNNIAPLTKDEIAQLVKAADIVTYARTAVERDYRGDVIDSHAPEMPTRFAKQLAQMVRGGEAIGIERDDAMKLALRCACDSIPQLRLDILLELAKNPRSRAIDVSRSLAKPRRTVRRELEALHMLGLLRCDEEKSETDEDRTVWFYSLAGLFNRQTLLSMHALRHPPNTGAEM